MATDRETSVRNVLAEVTRDDSWLSASLDTSLVNHDVDSLDAVEIIKEVEEIFGIKISDSEVAALTTIDSLVKLVDQKRKA